MRTFIYFIINIFVFTSAYSAECNCKIDNLNIYSTPHFYPFNYLENNKSTGAFVEIMNEVLKEACAKNIKVNLLPWARSYFLTQNKPNSLIFAIVKTEPRIDSLHWIGPFASSNFVMITKREKMFKPVETIGSLRKSYLSILAEKYKEKHPSVSIKKTSTIETGFHMLEKDRIDALIINHNLINKLIKEDKFSNYVIYENLDKQNIYIAFNKETNPEIMSCIEQKLKTLYNNGTIDKILQKYQINKPLRLEDK